MWLNEVDEIFKTYLPYYVLVFLPIFIIVSPTSPVSASYEFPAYRMQHYDLHGVPYGSRAASVNLEARALTTLSSTRHCVITKLTDLSVDTFRIIKGKVGAIIVILPDNISALTSEEKQQLLILENKMLFDQEITIPIYFTRYNAALYGIADELSKNIDPSDKKKSAGEALINSIAANGYQIVIGGGTPSVVTNNKIANIYGYLAGYRANGKVPTIVIVTHYDSFGIAPDLSYGVDSNGSGLIIFLELIRIFSTLYADPKTRGSFNILFVATGGGKINFQGSKKWLEDQLDATDSSLIQDASFVMCLDTLAASDTIFMHVSKPPKEGSHASTFYKYLKANSEQFNSLTVEGVHKKINLAEDILAWEHERFSIRRLPSFTLSTVKSHKDPWRFTILDDRESLRTDRLLRNTKLVVESVGKYVFNLPEDIPANVSLDISKSNIESWLKSISSQPRSVQLLTSKDNPFVANLQGYFSSHLSDVKVTYVIPDKRDPDYQFYGNTQGAMNIYRVKPAVFDLILTFAIITYLGAVYYVINSIPALYSFSNNLMKNKKIRSNYNQYFLTKKQF